MILSNVWRKKLLPPVRIELTAPGLRDQCSTTELKRRRCLCHKLEISSNMYNLIIKIFPVFPGSWDKSIIFTRQGQIFSKNILSQRQQMCSVVGSVRGCVTENCCFLGFDSVLNQSETGIPVSQSRSGSADGQTWKQGCRWIDCLKSKTMCWICNSAFDSFAIDSVEP